MAELVLVDFDDTLVDTAPRFHNARNQLFALLAEAGFSAEDARRVHYDDVDPKMRHQYGLGPYRMEYAFRATYEALCLGAACPVDDAVSERASVLGRTVAGTPPILDGALAALERLARALPVALYTQAGDAGYQMRCIEECGILDIIPENRIVIAERKTTERFLRVLADFALADPAQVWMVGNSMRSDINPALEAGANAILVECPEPWEFDLVEPYSDAFHKVGSFAEAVDFLHRNGA